MTTTARTDIHRPSAPEFDPEGYEFFGCFDLHPEWGTAGRAQIVSSLVAKGWSFAGAPHGFGQCSHCGAHLRYVALMGHTATSTLLYIGETCLDNRFSLTKGEFDALRKAALLNRERETKREKIAALLIQYPNLVWASYADNIGVAGSRESWYGYTDHGAYEKEFASREAAEAAGAKSIGFAGYRGGWDEQTLQGRTISTLSDIWSKVERYGDCSEKQATYVERMIGWLTEAEVKRAEREAKTAALTASGVKVPEGRVVIEGTVVSTKTVESHYGYNTTYTLKMVVVTDEGWKVYGTVPSSLPVDKGTRVRFTATVEPSKDDALFGFYKRPTKAEVVS